MAITRHNTRILHNYIHRHHQPVRFLFIFLPVSSTHPTNNTYLAVVLSHRHNVMRASATACTVVILLCLETATNSPTIFEHLVVGRNYIVRASSFLLSLAAPNSSPHGRSMRAGRVLITHNYYTDNIYAPYPGPFMFYIDALAVHFCFSYFVYEPVHIVRAYTRVIITRSLVQI